MQLSDLLAREMPARPWVDGDNIPWDEPAFSRRMLAEHLSQAHDMATRRAGRVEAQVAAIAEELPAEASVIDLACGPGVHLHALAKRGHRGVGVDFSPASIEHARERATAEGLGCSFEQQDLRTATLGRDFHLAMLLYGQLNVFRRGEARSILERAFVAIASGGRLVLELQQPRAIEAADLPPSSWRAAPRGLFSDRPHMILHERFWDAEERTGTQRWYVVDAESAHVTRHAMSTVAYTRDELDAILLEVGFARVRDLASVDDDFFMVAADKT